MTGVLILSAASLGMAGAVTMPYSPVVDPAVHLQLLEIPQSVPDELSAQERSDQAISRLAQAISRELMAYRAVATST